MFHLDWTSLEYRNRVSIPAAETLVSAYAPLTPLALLLRASPLSLDPPSLGPGSPSRLPELECDLLEGLLTSRLPVF